MKSTGSSRRVRGRCFFRSVSSDALKLKILPPAPAAVATSAGVVLGFGLTSLNHFAHHVHNSSAHHNSA